MRAPYPWLGGKNRSVPWILGLMPPHQVYVEPFFGAGNVFWNKERVDVNVINDLDSNVVNFMRVLRDPVKAEELKRQLELTPYSREEYGLAIEAKTAQGLSDIEKARTFFVLIRQGAVTGGKLTKGNWYAYGNGTAVHSKSFRAAVDGLLQYVPKLRDIVIEQHDALHVIKQWDTPNTLFYLDPPYMAHTRKRAEYTCEMDDSAHLELLRVIQQAKGMVMISGYPSDEYNVLTANGWHVETRQVKCMVATGKNGERGDRTECLWLNPAAMNRQLRLHVKEK